jgi:hypothetical protein
MLEIGWFSAKLLLKGRLMRDPMYVVRQTGIGVFLGLILLLSLSQADIPFWQPVVISSFVTGLIMPFLIKDLRMK